MGGHKKDKARAMVAGAKRRRHKLKRRAFKLKQ
jgi:hypothetical protein